MSFVPSNHNIFMMLPIHVKELIQARMTISSDFGQR